MGHGVVGQPAAVLPLVFVQQRLARRGPAGGVVLGYGRVQPLEACIGAVKRAHCALRADEGRARRTRHAASDGQARAAGAFQRLQPGAGGRALDEQRLARRDLQRGEQRTHDGAQVQDVGAGLLQCEVTAAGNGMQLRRLGDQKLRMAAGA